MSNNIELLRQANDMVRRLADDQYRKKMIESVGKDMVDSLIPVLEKMSREMRLSREDIKEMMSTLTIEPPAVNVEQPKVEVKMDAPVIPEIKTEGLKEVIQSAIQKGFSKIKIPKPEITVNPSVKIPKVDIPKIEFPSDLEISLRRDFDNRNPMPVILMDNKGNPYIAVSGAGAPRIVDVNVINPYTSIADGRRTVTTAGTAVRLTTVSTNAKTVIITALLANTDVIVIGGSGVIAAAGTRTGIPLLPGQAVTLAFSDLTNIWMDSVVNGEGVSFLVMN